MEKIAPVWMSDIFCLADTLELITQLGKIFSVQEKAQEICAKIQDNFAACKAIFEKQPNRVNYFIWRKPYMVAGKNTFIDFVLTHIGLRNMECKSRYPEVSLQQTNLNVDLVFLSSEPYPFGEKHFKEFQDAFPNAKICLVDGEMFSWYGTRLIYLNNYIQKELLLKINEQ